MRFTRSILEVVCGINENEADIHRDGRNILTNLPHLKHTCFNVFKISTYGVADTFSSPMSRRYVELMMERDELFAMISRGVLRCHALTSLSSGTGFPLAPEVLITNWHVTSELPKVIGSWKQETHELLMYNISACRGSFPRVPEYAIERSVLFTGASLPLRREQHLEVDVDERLDPILGTRGNFDVFDITLLSVHYLEQPKVLFIPSSRCVQPGSIIATLGYPGTEALTENLYANMHLAPAYRNAIPPFPYLQRIFYGFGGLCASVGTVVRPYKEKNGMWMEDDDINYTPHNHYALVSNETAFGGNSGGPMISLDDENKAAIIHEVEDTTGTVWRLVEFVAIHTGGEFISCVDCLQVLPGKREMQSPATLRACHRCLSTDHPTPTNTLMYNYSISVHHPCFVKMYKTKVVPGLVALFGRLPDIVQQFVAVHEQEETH